MSLEDRKELIQEVIDRLLYNPTYINELIKLNEKYPMKNRIINNGKVIIKK